MTRQEDYDCSRQENNSKYSVLPNLGTPGDRGVPPASLATGQDGLALQPEARGAGVLHGAAQPVVEEDRADGAVDDGARVDAGRHAGDLGPGRGPAPVRPAPRHGGARDHEAGPTAELGQVAGREGFLVVEMEVGGQGGQSAQDWLTPGSQL